MKYTSQIKELTQENNFLRQRVSELERELSDYKRGNAGECVHGEYCCACAHGISIGPFYAATCGLTLPCKRYVPKNITAD